MKDVIGLVYLCAQINVQILELRKTLIRQHVYISWENIFEYNECREGKIKVELISSDFNSATCIINSYLYIIKRNWV